MIPVEEFLRGALLKEVDYQIANGIDPNNLFKLIFPKGLDELPLNKLKDAYELCRRTVIDRERKKGEQNGKSS